MSISWGVPNAQTPTHPSRRPCSLVVAGLGSGTAFAMCFSV